MIKPRRDVARRKMRIREGRSNGERVGENYRDGQRKDIYLEAILPILFEIGVWDHQHTN